MKQIRIVFLLATLIFTVTALGRDAKIAAATSTPQAQQSPPTIASTVDREISAAEKQILDAAEAMPEDKFNFTPESLNILGSQYKGVRSFAVQVKHVAASNWFIWWPLTGDLIRQRGVQGQVSAITLTEPAASRIFLEPSALRRLGRVCRCPS